MRTVIDAQEDSKSVTFLGRFLHCLTKHLFMCVSVCTCVCKCVCVVYRVFVYFLRGVFCLWHFIRVIIVDCYYCYSCITAFYTILILIYYYYLYFYCYYVTFFIFGVYYCCYDSY